MGAKSAVMPGDAKLAAWLQERGITDFHFVASDPDAAYYSIVRLDVSGLKPQIAISPNIDDVVDVDEIAGKKIDQVVIGSCTNGRLEDFAAAANVLRGKHVAPGVRLILGPASRSVYHQMITSGIMESLLASGAVINPPGCGPCAGLHGGLIGDGEAVLSTTNRNMRGRMGSSKSDIYLCSPVTAAFSALKGSITGPYDEQGV
jgi:homoaconitase/3-isopropylmalate dehydratase large subunit